MPNPNSRHHLHRLTLRPRSASGAEWKNKSNAKSANNDQTWTRSFPTMILKERREDAGNRSFAKSNRPFARQKPISPKMIWRMQRSKCKSKNCSKNFKNICKIKFYDFNSSTSSTEVSSSFRLIARALSSFVSHFGALSNARNGLLSDRKKKNITYRY